MKNNIPAPGWIAVQPLEVPTGKLGGETALGKIVSIGAAPGWSDAWCYGQTVRYAKKAAIGLDVFDSGENELVHGAYVRAEDIVAFVEPA